MKLPKYILLFLFSILISFYGNTQPPSKTNLSSKGNDNSNEIYFIVKESFPENKQGQIFFSEKWADGIITDFKNNEYFLPLRYRVYKEEMQVMHDSKTKSLQIKQIKKVTFKNHVFIASKFIKNEEHFSSFFEIISDGKIQLLALYNTKESQKKYSIEKSFYFKRDNDPAEKFSPKKKDILKLMKDQESAIQKFIKTKKLNLKNAEDIKELFKYYNEL